MSLAVSSATGLGVLLMATLFPGNGECRYQPRGRRRHLRLTGGDYPLANLG
ncbi:hypothetical protein [Klebsiella pneumoniae IS39]|nr:hypothetical protein [Klebsiella pneumoniae IS39]